jgi:hypothetical protein
MLVFPYMFYLTLANCFPNVESGARIRQLVEAFPEYQLSWTLLLENKLHGLALVHLYSTVCNIKILKIYLL